MDLIWNGENNVELKVGQIGEDEGTMLAIPFDFSWKSDSGVSLERDPLGNILIIPHSINVVSVNLRYDGIFKN